MKPTKSTQELAIEWWNKISPSLQVSYVIRYNNMATFNIVTGNEIEDIWRKETQEQKSFEEGELKRNHIAAEQAEYDDDLFRAKINNFSKLSDEVLAKAFAILFDNGWKMHWPIKSKAEEMRNIIQSNDQPCRPFINWVRCINFLTSNS